VVGPFQISAGAQWQCVVPIAMSTGSSLIGRQRGAGEGEAGSPCLVPDSSRDRDLNTIHGVLINQKQSITEFVSKMEFQLFILPDCRVVVLLRYARDVVWFTKQTPDFISGGSEFKGADISR